MFLNEINPAPKLFSPFHVLLNVKGFLFIGWFMFFFSLWDTWATLMWRCQAESEALRKGTWAAFHMVLSFGVNW